MKREARWAALAIAVLVGSAAGASAEVRRVESVGAIAVYPDVRRSSPPRDAAVRRALDTAVWDVARSLAPDIGAAEAEEVFPAALGSDPFQYTNRFRIIEDRGEVPASITSESGAPTEYVVVVDASIDAGRVEDRLREAGLLFTRAGGGDRRITVVVEQLADFVAYEHLLESLVSGARARSAVPTEFERGRAVIEVTAETGPARLLDDLVATAPPGLSIQSLGIAGETLTLRIAYEAPPEPDPASATTTPLRNRRN